MKRMDGNRLNPLIEEVDDGSYYQRQLLPPVYRLTGAVDVVWRSTVSERGFMYGGDMRGYVMPAERSIDLDSELDFALARLLLERREL
jgi:N-acylneuraminate cytidylyltransferase/CMP-N,N'-diacetyllegionaminic acid synthase